MMNRTAVIAALSFSSLATVPAGAQTRAVVAPLTTADTNRIIAARVGQILTIDLRQSAGTGSSWRMVLAAGLIQVGPPIVVPAPRGGPPIAGGPMVQMFRVRVAAPGELALTFVNARTFGGPDQQAETATFVLEAK